MYKINPMVLMGLGKEEGLLVSWLPDGMLIELSGPKLEGLKAQYEEQVAALQQQVSAMQNHQADRVPPDLHAQLQQAVEALRQKLGEDHRQMLDQLLAELDSQFQEQISQLKAQHAEEVTLQVQAMKIAAEQVHQSHLRLVQAELETRHQEELAETQACLLQQQPSLQQFAHLSQAWENQYTELTQRLGRDLDTRLTQMLQALQDGSSSQSQNQESSPALPASVQEIQQLLSSQQEEMTALRSRCLAEFEESLRARSDNMVEQSAEVAALQAEIDTLQQQYQQLLKEKQSAASGDSEDPEELRKALAELKAYYEKRVETIEQTFEEEIAQLKAKYEADMTAAHGEGTDVDGVVSSLAQERAYKVQAPLVSAVLNEDSHEEEEEEGSAVESRVRELEQAVAERERQIQELQRQLEEERTRVGSLEAACKEDKERLNTALAQLQELKQSAETELPSQASSDTVPEKDSELEKYRSELSEKDQHIAELVDMESFLLKENGQLKQQVSDLEAQLKELTESDSNRREAGESERVKELEAMVAEKQEACEKFLKDLEEREKEVEVLRVESESFQELKQQWQQKESDLLSEKDKLCAQVEELSEKSKELQARLDDAEHRHQEQMEAVRQELEHERQVEVETLQSEFKVQLEIELKRQAVELSSKTSSTQQGQQDEGDSVDSKETPGQAAGEEEEEDGTSVDAALAAVESSQEQDAEAERQEDAPQSEDLTDSGDLLSQYQARITELEKELKDLQNRHTSLLSGEGPEIEQLLKERYDNELELAKSFQQSEFDDMIKAEKKKVLERHRSLMDGFMKEKQEEMEQLKAEHERELEETRTSLLQEYEEKMRTQQQAELQTAESSSEQTEELGLIQQQLQTEVQSLQQMLGEKEQALESREREIADKLQELEALHQHKLLQVAQDYDSRMTQARQELETAHQEELERQLQQLESKHSKELANLQQQHQSAVEQLQQEHQSAVEQLQKEHQSAVEQLKQEHQSAVEQLQASHQAELQKVEEARGAAQSQGMLSEVTEISMPVATVQQTTAAPEEHLPVWSTPRPGSSETVTRSFAQVVSGIPPIPQTSASEPPTSPPTSTSRADTPTPDGKAEEEKDRIIEKLQAEVAALTQRLERSAAHGASPGGQEVGGGDNMLSMLRADLETTGSEREVLHRANDRLLQLLSNAVKTYLSVEDGINRRLARIVSHGSRAGRPPSAEPPSRHSPPADSAEPRDAECRTPTPHCEGAEGGDSQDTTLEETSILSSATDEGLDVSQRLVESLFLGPDLDAEGEELVQDAQERLQRAVLQLLDMMERSTQQLIEAQRYQEEILASLETSHQDLQAEKSRAEEGEDRLRDESSAKEYLAQELHKAEGLISGYTVEREEMERRLQRLEEEREVMAGELERLRSKLSDLEEDQQSLQAQRQALQRQQSLLQQNAGTENQALLGELSKMTEVRHQLQQQLKHQAERSQANLRELESISEEQQQRMEKELETQRAEITDLKLQLDNTERQLKAKKQFIDEQSTEREQEREEFQREMDQMKERLASFDRRGHAEGRLQQEVEDLTEQLESRMLGHSEMQQRTEQMQRELQERERTEEELKLSLTQLEKELEDKATTETQLQQRIQRLEEQLVGQASELETSEGGMSPPTKEQRGSPRMLSPERQRLPRNLLSLQDELLRARQLEDELQQEKELLQQQVQEQMLQISALRNQLDDLKHWGTDPVTSSSHLADLRQQLQSLRDQLEKRDQEVGMLEEEKEKLREKMSLQEAEMDTFREAIKSGSLTEVTQVDTLTQERDRLQHEVETLREQLAEREVQGGETHSQQSSLSGDYSLTDRDPRLLNVSITQRTNFQQELEQTVAEKEAALAELELEADGSRRQLAELQTQLTDVQAQLAKVQEESEARQEQLSEKETAVEQLQEQVESLQQEVSSLTTFQNELQKDFDEVQVMLEEKQRQMEGLTRELADSRMSAETPDPELVVKLEREIVALKKELQEKLNVINEKEEEMYVLNEKLEQQESESEVLKTAREERDLAQAGLQEARQELEQLKEQLQELAGSSRAEEEQDGALQMELYATQEEKRLLEEELEEKDRLLGVKEAELEELRKQVKEGQEMTEEPSEQEEETKVRAELLERRLTEREREIGTLKSQLEAAKSAASSSRAKDSASHQEVLELQSRLQKAQDTITQLRRSRRLELPRTEDEEEEEGLPADVVTLQEQLQHLREELELFRSTASMSAADFVKKVMELRRELSEAHQEQIRDVQTRFADEEEARLSMLQQRHQLELDQQKKVWERRLATAVAQECQTLEQQHSASMGQMRQQHQQQLDTLLRSRAASVEDAAVLERLQARLPDSALHADSSSPDINASVSDISSLDLTGDESVSSRLQMLLERLHRDGLHLLTLSELQFLRRHLSPETQPRIGDVDAVMAAWERERQTQASTINSLKELLSQAHRASIGEKGQELEGDWRGELLKALCNVFSGEREKLLAELSTLLSSQSADSRSALDVLEKRVQDQETQHREALQQLLTADRQSLLEEVRELRGAGSGGRQELSQLQDRLAEVEDAAQQKEWQLQRKVQVLEYKLQQETVIEEDLKASLAAEQGRVAELNQQVGREKERSLELQTELTSAQIHTAKARDALEREQNRFTSVSDALEEAKEERTRLLELLEMERKRRHSQTQETTLQHSQQEANTRFIKELSAELERERAHSSDLARQLEMQNTRYSTLEQELETQARLAQRASAELTNQITQLQQALNSETERTAELARALERERQLRQTKEQEEVDSGQSELSIADLRSQLVAEQALITDLQAALEREQSQTSSARQLLEEERRAAQEALQEQQSSSRHLASRLEAVQGELLQAQEQLERRSRDAASSQREQEGRLRTLEAAVRRQQEEEQRLQREAAASTRRQRQQDNALEELKVKVHNYELDIERLNQRSRELLAQRESARDGAEEDAELQQHLALSKRHLESILQRLEHVTVQLQQLPQSAGEHPQPQSSSQLQQQLDNILTEVRQLQRPVTGQEAQRSAQAVLGSFINERVLQHNAELNSYIAVLCREKEELRNTNTQLEQQVETSRIGRRRSLQGEAEGSSTDSEEEMLRQRAMWASEKLTLQMALDSAEREVEHLQTELRHFRQQLDSDNLLANPKRDKMNKLYGKYLRAESYRRALIYQKRYLLQLLGGFEDCERETLDIIAAMGAHPNAHDVQQRQHRFARPLNRFRAAAYSCIAVTRLRYLVRKWRRATRVGSPVITGRLDVNTGYVPTAGSFSPPTSPPRTARSQPPGPPPRPSVVAYSRGVERTSHSSQLHSNQIHSSHHSSHSRSLHSAPHSLHSLSSAPAYSQLPLDELSQESLESSHHYSAGAAFLPPASTLASRGTEFEHASSRGLGGRDGGYDYETGYGTEQARLRSYPMQGGERSAARQQANGSSSAASSSFSSGLRFSTPPTRERSSPRDLRSPTVGSARRRILQDFEGNARPSNRTRESHNDEFIQRLENLQHRLSGYSPRDHSRSKQRHTLSLH